MEFTLTRLIVAGIDIRAAQLDPIVDVSRETREMITDCVPYLSNRNHVVFCHTPATIGTYDLDGFIELIFGLHQMTDDSFVTVHPETPTYRNSNANTSISF